MLDIKFVRENPEIVEISRKRFVWSGKIMRDWKQ